MALDIERIVSILIHLLEDQEDSKIRYEIIPIDNAEQEAKETA